MVPAAMPELQFVGLRPVGERQDLMPEADPEDRIAPDQRPDRRDGLGNVDLVLRTSGEFRLSNFLIWQMAYSELYFTDIYWPGFRYIDFLRAIRSFQQRNRRYGT